MQNGFSGIVAIGLVAAVVAVVIMFGFFTNPKQSQKDEVTVPVADVVKDADGNTETRKGNVDYGWKVEEGEKNNVEPTGKVVGQDSGTITKGSYEAYSADKIAMAATGDVVLFFHASWCPSCRGLNADIEKNLSSIPAGVIILKTDYDKETDLKKKYEVTYQHTLVQVDKDGNLIKKWSGGSKLENLLSQIQ